MESCFAGLSSASLEITDAEEGSTSTGIFSGNLSSEVEETTKWNISRSGFCGMRSKKFDGFIDLDSYDTIALKVKGDGRCYISTVSSLSRTKVDARAKRLKRGHFFLIYTENWVNSPGQMEDNSWQAFLYVPRDHWYIAKIPLSRYLPTWRGNVIDANLEMNPCRVLGLSLSVNAEARVPGSRMGPGDFRLEIDWIKALRA
ncbi:hypothetical protein Leryth_012603 [Lithospermum erythrorhizon]|nr:hypothetical protein Leryth_012603 [Lithospermum erythrorhizon]